MHQKTIATALRWLAICSTGFAVASCGQSDGQAIKAGEEAVKERLTDPYSAHFSDEFVIQKQVSNGKDTGQSISVCGFVNSKNVLGGYTGKRHFITRTIAPWNKKPSSVNLEDDVMRSAAVSDHNPKPSLYEDIYWNRDCVDEKHPPTYTGQ